MKCNVEVKANLEYKNDAGTQVFLAGDDVICSTNNGRRYVGKIVTIGAYQKDKETESEPVVYINISNKTNCSVEPVKVADITCICKNPLNDIIGFPMINREKDEDIFIHMIVGLGYDRECAKVMYDSMKGIISLYNIPFSSILANVIQEIDFSVADKSQKELIDIANKCMTMLINIFQTITNMLKKKENEMNTISGNESKNN